MNKLKQILTWLDVHALFILSAFLIVFIPLFPKIPIFDVLPGYIVRARPEDVLIFITALVWIKDVIKKRIKIKTTYLWMVILFTVSGAISILLGTILIETIPAQLLHIGKSGLHLFRYLEYFALFFFTYSSIKTQKQLHIVLGLLVATVFFVVLYGFGQEYYHLPLFSTMNREYSKGTTLYLQEGARPQSTFAGHYDLAAYLVIVLPILFSLALGLLQIDLKNIKETFKLKQNYVSVLFHIVHILGAWMLVTSGSKTALLAYIVSLSIVIMQYLRKLGSFRQQLKWGSIALVISSIGLVVFLNFFATTTRDKLISLVQTAVSGANTPENVTNRPDDLIGEGHEYKQVTIKNEDGTETKEWIKQESVWSANALKYGLSMGIRLDTLWPNALKGLMNNPLFGSGFATLSTIESVGDYTFADSTDNNFLRTLGETGILGFIIFYGFIAVITIEIYKQTAAKTLTALSLRIGFLGAIFGLLINAVYIDVFAASKVAYTFWSFAGLTLAVLKPNPTNSIRTLFKHLHEHGSVYFILILSFFLLHKNPFNKNALIRNLDVSTTQIESLTSAKCFIQTGSFTVCRPNGLVLKDNLNIYSVLLVPIYKIYDNPMMFYVLNLILIITTLVVMYIVLKQKKIKPLFTVSSLLLFVLTTTFFAFTNTPHTTSSLVLYLLILPTILLIAAYILNRITFRIAYIVQICIVLVMILQLTNKNFDATFTSQFRNKESSDKLKTIELANIHFDETSYMNRKNDFYLITSLNPYYIDLFSNNNYKLLPLSELQLYLDKPEKVYEALTNFDVPKTQQYAKLLEKNSLFVTNYGVSLSQENHRAFSDLKSQFDLTYTMVGCNDQCNFYSLAPETEKISPIPQSVNTAELKLGNLQKPYSFTVVSNRFEPKTTVDEDILLPYSTLQFASNLQKSISKNTAFTAITGDILDYSNEKNNALFNKRFDRSPILYAQGNTDLNPTKIHPTQDSYFFTNTEFFLLLNVGEDSRVTLEQQRFVYNTLLKIEKLPNIKNIFIISHNLNWQNRTDKNNFIFELEKKLSEFPQIRKFIITSHHSQTTDPVELRTEISAKHITDSVTNTDYLSSYTRNWSNDSFFEFTVNTDNTVSVFYKIKGENF
ncbi:O-antigen ligase family protein [Candidatus Woesebacteria bacterium]|nr:O-antigen ligase family protein [Candidatus Woesebacteria bacterium]